MGAADSKLAFKKGVFRLFEDRNIPYTANDYWEQFWTLPESADDVFLLVGSQDIRRVRDEARENLVCLVEKTLAQLFRLCDSPDFLTPNSPAIHVLNCVRILTRVFPFIFESQDLLSWEESYFWNPRATSVPDKTPEHSGSQTIDQAADGLRGRVSEIQLDPEGFAGTASDSIFQGYEQEGRRLVKTLLDLLFTSGFTLPTALETTTRVSYVIWETGVGSSKPIGTSKELDDNRTEILRLLLVLFSRSMYISPASITTAENRWIDTVVTGSDRQATLAILCSLINSALKYNPSGWGLPYNHVMFSDQRELLVMLCLQVIVILLDYNVAEKPHGRPLEASTPAGNESGLEADQGSTGSLSSAASSPSDTSHHTIKNHFQFYLSRLHREQDFMFLTDGMYRILSNPMAASSTYLPGSTKQVKCHQETLMFCWKAIELNKRFRNYLFETNRVLDVVVILLYFALEYKQDTSHIGLVRMCACMLQTLSKERAFGNCMNNPFDGHASLPANVRIPNFHGTYADYLICSIHHLIATTKRALRSLYPALISTLVNISPHLKNISPLASSRLLQLMTSLASPSFLLAEESNHELLGILLDAVCNVFYYQAFDNPNLMYALVQYEPKIQTMAGFTLQRGLDDIHRLRFRKIEDSSPAQLSGESGQLRVADGRPRRPTAPRLQSYQGSYGDSSQQHSRRPHLPRRESAAVMEISTSGISSWSSVPASSSTTSSPSLSIPPKMADDVVANEAPAVKPTLERPDSSDSILAPPSDGGGHEGDVEDDGGPSTVLKCPKERSAPTISEKARGKLPDASHPFSTLRACEESSCKLDRQDSELGRSKRVTTSISTSASRRPHLSTRVSSFRQQQATTAFDVGQNGFIPTEEWVQGWMSTLRFKPLLTMLQCVIPKIESIHAVNDHQVLDHIRTNVIPMLQQILPESERPPVLVRKVVWSELTLWFQGLLWSQVYLGGGGRLGRQGLGAWYETGVKLFSIPYVASSITTASSATGNVTSGAAPTVRAAGSTFTTATESSTGTWGSQASLSGPSASLARSESKGGRLPV